MPMLKNPFKKKSSSSQPLTVQSTSMYPLPFVSCASTATSLAACQSMIQKYYGGNVARYETLEVDGYHNELTKVGYSPIIITGRFDEEGINSIAEHSLVIKGEKLTHFVAHCPFHGANVKVKKLIPYIRSIHTPKLKTS